MGSFIEVEVEIDDYVDNITDSVLMQEAIYRLDKKNVKEYKKKFLNLLLDDNDDIVELIAHSKNLNIIDAEKLRDFLNNLG